MKKPIYRKVVGSEYRDNPGAWKSRFTGGWRRINLECGHHRVAKGSIRIPFNCRCSDCERLRDGSARAVSEIDEEAGTGVLHGWDEAKQWPTFTKVNLADIPGGFEFMGRRWGV